MVMSVPMWYDVVKKVFAFTSFLTKTFPRTVARRLHTFVITSVVFPMSWGSEQS